MKIKTHMKITKKKFDVEAKDIHEWIDEFFDKDKFQVYLSTGYLGDFNPYDHRAERHCSEMIEECVAVFRNKYPENIIKAVFESHVREDYDGYFPSKNDFLDPKFHKKYHRK